MRLQTDLEFNQNQIKKINDEFNVEIFTPRFVKGKPLLQNRKEENLKKFYYEVNDLKN